MASDQSLGLLRGACPVEQVSDHRLLQARSSRSQLVQTGQSLSCDGLTRVRLVFLALFPRVDRVDGTHPTERVYAAGSQEGPGPAANTCGYGPGLAPRVQALHLLADCRAATCTRTGDRLVCLGAAGEHVP